MFAIVRLISFALAAVAVACGGAAAPSATVPPGTTTPTITYSGFAVSPASVEVKAGETVAWTNKDGTTHTVTAGRPGAKTAAFDKQVPGNTATSVTFATAGTFDYFCEFHPSMTGKVVVR